LFTNQEWEANASRDVSIVPHLEAITGLILDWRRLELKSWNRLLDDARMSAVSDVTKWWFHLFNVVEDNIYLTQG